MVILHTDVDYMEMCSPHVWCVSFWSNYTIYLYQVQGAYIYIHRIYMFYCDRMFFPPYPEIYDDIHTSNIYLIKDHN